jgi:hypothetical protein
MGDSALIAALIGRPFRLPDALVACFPELDAVQWRRGGIPVRVAGWCLGRRPVAAIALWRVVWLAPGVAVGADLLLHEVRHVHQFQASRAFPMLYLWESIRSGYHRNRFEADARAYAARRLGETA